MATRLVRRPAGVRSRDAAYYREWFSTFFLWTFSSFTSSGGLRVVAELWPLLCSTLVVLRGCFVSLLLTLGQSLLARIWARCYWFVERIHPATRCVVFSSLPRLGLVCATPQNEAPRAAAPAFRQLCAFSETWLVVFSEGWFSRALPATLFRSPFGRFRLLPVTSACVASRPVLVFLRPRKQCDRHSRTLFFLPYFFLYHASTERCVYSRRAGDFTVVTLVDMRTIPCSVVSASILGTLFFRLF